jgi:hypothetical protein
MELDAAEERSCPVDSSHCSVFIKGGLDVLHCIIHACSFDAKIVNKQT